MSYENQLIQTIADIIYHQFESIEDFENELDMSDDDYIQMRSEQLRELAVRIAEELVSITDILTADASLPFTASFSGNVCAERTEITKRLFWFCYRDTLNNRELMEFSNYGLSVVAIREAREMVQELVADILKEDEEEDEE